jgi:hypothetical protein
VGLGVALGVELGVADVDVVAVADAIAAGGVASLGASKRMTMNAAATRAAPATIC